LKKHQSIIFDLQNFSKNEIDSKLKIYINKFHHQLENDGILWIFCNFTTNKKFFFPAPFYIAEKLNSYLLKNIIIHPNFENSNKGNLFNNYITNILFLTKGDKYYFNKDPIREKHIWKNVEWGKRKKNYHPKGKDPGNVWLKTLDDGKANIIEHCPLSYADILNRCISCSTKKDSSVLLLNIKKLKTKFKILYEKI
jgi:hypothetical protein